MSLKGKYTTINDVIERVRRDGINDFTKEEAKEWVWEIISLLGVASFYVDKVAVLLVENARTCLPYDLYDISEGGVREFYSKVTLDKETNIFYDPDNIGVDPSTLNFEWEFPSVVWIDGVEQEITPSFLVQLPPFSIYNSEHYSYKINDGFLFTGFKDGLIELAYKGFPVDNDNSPMLPDDFKVIRAAACYIKKKVMNRMWLRDEVSLQKLQKIERDYSFAVASARTNATIGSIEDWETIRKITQRLRRDPNAQKNGFSSYGIREGLNLNG